MNMPEATLNLILEKVVQLDGKIEAVKNELKAEFKAELTRFVSKDDLSRFATKDDFKDLEDKVDTIAIHILEMDEKIDRCTTKEELYTVKNDLIKSMDRFAKHYETVDQEMAALIGRDDRLEDRIEVLEKNRV